MRRRNSGPFVAQRDGTYVMNLAPDVQALLVHMFGEFSYSISCLMFPDTII